MVRKDDSRRIKNGFYVLYPQEILKETIEEEHSMWEAEEQCESRAVRLRIDKPFCLKQVIEKKVNTRRNVHLLFINLTKDYDTVLVKKYGRFCKTQIFITPYIPQDLYRNFTTKMKIGDRITRGFVSNKGLNQGHCLSPTLFKIYVEYTVKARNSMGYTS